MFIARTIAELHAELRRLRPACIGFVPTMGYLHAGHRSLVERAASECDHAVVSIFVNPTQFGPGEDFARYPRDEARDIALLEAASASLLFAPSRDEMYPRGFDTLVQPGAIAQHLEGASRPGHFSVPQPWCSSCSTSCSLSEPTSVSRTLSRLQSFSSSSAT